MKVMVQRVFFSALLCGFFAMQVEARPRYPIFSERATQVLDGSWSFAWLGAAEWTTLEPSSVTCSEITAVPGVFDTAIDNFSKQGTGVYRRQVTMPAGRLRLKIGGLGLYAKLWWDDMLINEIKLPYASVDLDFMNPTDGAHMLTIAVDNRFSEITAPLFKPNYDFYSYGGIYRGIAIESLPVQRIERVRVTTLDHAAGRIRIHLDTVGVVDGKMTVMTGFDNLDESREEIEVKDNVAEWEVNVPNAKIWSPESPGLHVVRVALGKDRVVDRFGIRTIRTEGRQIILNGKPIRLKGVNRHESHPEFGPVQSTHLMVDDIRLVRALGANFIRCVHYQHDPEFYELCDESGLLVWAESLGWGLQEDDLLKLAPLLLEETRILGNVIANHPSVIIAGFLNECASDKKSSLPLYQALAGVLRETAPGALVSYGTNRIKKDLCFSVCDVLSINYYPGWIGPVVWEQSSSSQISGYIEEIAQWFDTPANKDVYDKPLITSETGCCGVYGLRDRAMAQWSEDYQADYFVTSIQASMSNPRFCGVVLWQLFDTRSYVNRGAVRGKYRGYNNAGLVDEYRRPKLAYAEVQKVFKELK